MSTEQQETDHQKDMAKKGATGLAGMTVGATKGMFSATEKVGTNLVDGVKQGNEKHGVLGGLGGLAYGAVKGGAEGTAALGTKTVEGTMEGPKL